MSVLNFRPLGFETVLFQMHDEASATSAAVTEECIYDSDQDLVVINEAVTFELDADQALPQYAITVGSTASMPCEGLMTGGARARLEAGVKYVKRGLASTASTSRGRGPRRQAPEN